MAQGRDQGLAACLLASVHGFALFTFREQERSLNGVGPMYADRVHIYADCVDSQPSHEKSCSAC